MEEVRERRTSTRVKCDHSITFSLLRMETGKMRDLSEGGARIKTSRQMIEEKEIELFIPIEESSVAAKGRVVYTQRLGNIYNVGIDFIQIEEENIQAMLEFFKQNSLEDMRRFPRLLTDHSISFYHLEMGAGKMRDLSEGGVKIKTHRPFQLAGDVEIFLPLEGKSIIAKGRVARVQRVGDLYDVGVSFTEIDEENKEALLEFFKRNSPEELRRFPRLLCDHSITYSHLGMGSGRMLDLSGEGLRIMARHSFLVETDVDISIPIEGRFIIIKGRIARVQKTGDLYDIGIYFTEINEENRQVLIEYFEQSRRQDMRKSPRMPAMLSISYACEGTGAGRMMDLSEGGVKIKTNRPFEVETDVEMFLPIEHECIIAKGRVVRVQRVGAFYDVGISFTEIEEGNKQALLEFFKQRQE